MSQRRRDRQRARQPDQGNDPEAAALFDAMGRRAIALGLLTADDIRIATQRLTAASTIEERRASVSKLLNCIRSRMRADLVRRGLSPDAADRLPTVLPSLSQDRKDP